MIGRTDECRALEELLAAVRDGQSRVLVVHGDAGVGKSALLQALIAAAANFQVVLAHGVESEMELPFGGLQQVCGSLLDGLDELPAPQRDAARVALGLTEGTSPDRLLLGLAVLNLVSAASERGAVLCVVDDAQWLDHASLQSLTFVARRLLADPVAMVLATRGTRAELDEFPALFVSGLSTIDAQALLSSVLSVPLDTRVRDRIVAETGGNPLALVEWPRAMTPAQLAGGFGLPALPRTSQIEETFRRRIGRLPEATQRLLTVAAAEPTGDTTLVWRAAKTLGVKPADAVPAVDDELIEIGLQVWFRHPLVRSAAYASATLAERQAAHRALGEATDGELDPDRHAWHRALGSPGPDDEIADALEQSAGRAQARGGLAAAGALLERSATLTLDPSRRAQRILASAAACLEAGSFETAARLLATAQAAPLDEMGRAQVELLWARHAIFGGDIRDGSDLLLGAARRLEPLDLGLASMAHVQAMGVAEIVGVLGHGAGPRETAEAAMACPTPPVMSAQDWLRIGTAQLTLEGPSAAAPALRRALEPVDDTQVAQASLWQAYQTGVALLLWDIETYHQLTAHQVETARELGLLSMLPVGLNALAQAFLLEGTLDDAASALTEAEQIRSATGTRLAFSPVAALVAGWRDTNESATVIDRQISTSREGGEGMSLASASWARATLHNGRGQYADALAAANEAMQLGWERGRHIWLHELVEAAVRSREVATATDALEHLRASTEASGSDWAIGIQRRSEALLAKSPVAEDYYREAIERLHRTPIRAELARSHLLFGEWLRRDNRRAEARGHLRTAHEMFTEMGIYGFAERTRHELLATGETVRKRTAGSFEELTPQEAHIARLAAERRTNPEIGEQLFISPRTVEYHLGKVFTKLGISSRRELSNALAR